MPTALKLEQYGDLLVSVFGDYVFQVGSSLTTTDWRDVDVRALLEDDEYERQGYGDPERPQENAKWVATVLAFSLLGKEMTGLPIDFQIQQRTHANTKYDYPRSSLGVMSWIMRQGRK